jgi:acyl carrier protein
MTQQENQRSEPRQASVPAVEDRIIGIWAEVLQIRVPIALDSDFFGLGGDSLAMMMVLFRVGQEFSVELSPAALLEAPTPRMLAALIAPAALLNHTDGG